MTYSIVYFTHIKYNLYLIMFLNLSSLLVGTVLKNTIFYKNLFSITNRPTFNYTQKLVCTWDYENFFLILPFFVQNIIFYALSLDNVDEWFFNSTWMDEYMIPYTFVGVEKPKKIIYPFDKIRYFRLIRGHCVVGARKSVKLIVFNKDWFDSN